MQDQVQSTEFAIFLTTAPNPGVAQDLARGLVTSHLAGCVNVIPQAQSFYLWDGALGPRQQHGRSLNPSLMRGSHQAHVGPGFEDLPLLGGR